jgi:urease accessory protein
MLVFEQIIFTEKESSFSLKSFLNNNNIRENILILSLTAEERSRSRYRFTADNGQDLFIQLPRGTILDDGDLLQAKTGEYLIIKAKVEQVLTITSSDYLQLMKAIYHLANRHTPIEISPNYLRISFDPVLAKMITDFGLEIIEEKAPFYPEKGAYQH